MIKLNCDKGEIVVECGGSVQQVAAEICEGISALYAHLPAERRFLFRSCIELAVSHEDTPMWNLQRHSGSGVEIRSAGGELERQLRDILQRSESDGGERDAD